MPTPEVFTDAPETFSINEAARLLGLNHQTIRKAVRNGEIPAFIIGNREPLKSGRGMGYRITRADLQAWYFGKGQSA
jgi:excisionase family DNA binding protein